MEHRKLWTDMHSNIHHEKMEELAEWFAHVENIMDFWPIAYYPFCMRKTKFGLDVEDIHEVDKINKDWETLRVFTKEINEKGFPMFMGYEWQGNGCDGDHNVFFLDNEQMQHHPMTYKELVQIYNGVEAIGIPHHIAYQLGSRGKNWETHNEKFSPVAEIYSSHGCSETDDISIEMNRHVHMGPRTGNTNYDMALESGHKVGIIAAGDNHSLPAVFEHGSMCVLAKSKSKEDIWNGIRSRHTYGVSKSRIEVDFSINDAIMGDEISIKDSAILKIEVVGTSAVDRIEILKNNIVEEMVVHSGKWENDSLDGLVRFKFRIEFGWGPDTRVYKDIFMKKWKGKLSTEGNILNVEKCFNNLGQEVQFVGENSCEFNLTTYKSDASGKWMGPSNITTEGFIFDIEADINSDITLIVDDKIHRISVKSILKQAQVIPLMEDIIQLTKDTWGDVTHYRDDPWWHNAYKFKISKGCVERGFKVNYEKKIAVDQNCNYRLRVWQKNGDIAWTSPIFINKQ